MAVTVKNGAGEKIGEYASDAEAVRAYLESGRAGDYMEDGEYLSDVALEMGFKFTYDRMGCVNADPNQDPT